MKESPLRRRLLTGTIIAAIVIYLFSWQAGSLHWTAPGATRWAGVAIAVIAYLAFCALLLLSRRRVAAPSPSMPNPSLLPLPVVAGAAAPSPAIVDSTLVVYASQTGFAQQLAEQTTDSLVKAGCYAQLMALNDVDAAMLISATRVLFIASTTGEGDPPDTAYGFVRKVMGQSCDLSSLSYGLLALGDRDYESFCGFGHQLDSWLRENGALPLFDLIEVDNGDAATLRHWQHQIGTLAGEVDLPDWEAPSYANWLLSERSLLNPGSVGGPVFHVALTAPDASTSWRAGDIIEVGPRNSTADIRDYLQALGLDGATSLGEETLAERLARAAMPPLDSVRGLQATELAAAMTDLPHREYSIASVPADGAVHLLIRQVRRADGRLGIGGGWLTEYAAVGSTIEARIRANPAFRAPSDDRPLILVGNGTGIAGLRALLRERILNGHQRNWLLFGERNAEHDFYYGDEIRSWLAQGQIERLDLAFSRDQAERIHVQQRVREAGDTLRVWVEQGAAIYVCGSLEGMAPGVHAALIDALGAARVEQLTEQGRYRRDVY